jgi:hypothetical protein
MSIDGILGATFVLCCAFLSQPSMLLQAPSQPGRIAISSTPSGAYITIDGQRMNQLTDATFVASQGTHNVSVIGGPGNLNCSERKFQVSSGQVTKVYCSEKGWE